MAHETASKDLELLAAATEVLRRNFRDPVHSVGATIRSASGKVYAAVNVDSACYGPYAEPIDMGMAISSGERKFTTIVAVEADGKSLPPCGNCRQLLSEHAPGVEVLLTPGSVLERVPIADLPEAYTRPET